MNATVMDGTAVANRILSDTAPRSSNPVRRGDRPKAVFSDGLQTIPLHTYTCA